MIKKALQILKFLIPVGLAGVLIYFAFRNVDFESFWANLGHVDYRWVGVSLGISVIPYLARAYRWNLLLSPLGYKTRIYPTTLAILIGYLANLAVPRFGEIVRCGFLQRSNKVPLTVSVGTVIAERIIDMLTLLGLILLALVLQYDVLWEFLSPYFLQIDRNWLIGSLTILGVGGIAGIILLFSLMKQGRFPKLQKLVRELVNGILSIRKVKSPLGFILATLVMWTVYYLMSYVIVFSLEVSSHLTLEAGLLLLVTGGIAIALPVQSGFGTYHTMIPALLLIYGIPTDSGLFLATLLHTSQIIAVALLGAVALVLALFLEKPDESDEAENSDAA